MTTRPVITIILRVEPSGPSERPYDFPKGEEGLPLKQYDNRVDEGIGLVLDEHVVLAVFFSVVE